MARQHDATIHTDGGCEPNPGAGGWAAVIHIEGGIIELTGNESNTTNNRMELMAAISGIEALDSRGKTSALLYTDSQYVLKGITQWIKGWKRTGWKNGTVKNQELWMRLEGACARHHIEWRWLRGHAGHELNERCDFLATEQINLLKGRASAPVAHRKTRGKVKRSKTPPTVEETERQRTTMINFEKFLTTIRAETNRGDF
jgi:ribonuclease HI